MLDNALDKMSNEDHLTRLALLTQVRAKVEAGVTVKRACKDLGYPRSTYYKDLAELKRKENAA